MQFHPIRPSMPCQPSVGPDYPEPFGWERYMHAMQSNATTNQTFGTSALTAAAAAAPVVTVTLTPTPTLSLSLSLTLTLTHSPFRNSVSGQRTVSGHLGPCAPHVHRPPLTGLLPADHDPVQCATIWGEDGQSADSLANPSGRSVWLVRWLGNTVRAK